MQIEVQEVGDGKLNVIFEADPEQVENKRFEVIQYLQKSAIPGFRAGKAPVEAVKHHFKNKINEVVKAELAQSAFHLSMAEKNIRPFGSPQFSSALLTGDKFSCTFSINRLPDVELKQYKGFDLPKGHIPNAVQMAEKILQELRVRNGETIPFGDADFLQQGDTAIVNYFAISADNQEPVIKKDGEMITVGASDLDAFNENLLGMKVGEKREFNVLLPLNHTFTDFAGKELRFTVELGMGSKSNPAPLDDTLATKVGAKDLKELIEQTHGVAGKRIQELQSRYLNEQIANRLIENHTVEIPDWLAQHEGKLLARQYGNAWENLTDEQKTGYLTAATKNVKLSIILDKIRETEPEAQSTDEEIMGTIQANLANFKSSIPNMEGKSDQEIFETVRDSGHLPILIAHIKDDYTMDFITKSSSIIE